MMCKHLFPAPPISHTEFNLFKVGPLKSLVPLAVKLRVEVGIIGGICSSWEFE